MRTLQLAATILTATIAIAPLTAVAQSRGQVSIGLGSASASVPSAIPPNHGGGGKFYRPYPNQNRPRRNVYPGGYVYGTPVYGYGGYYAPYYPLDTFGYADTPSTTVVQAPPTTLVTGDNSSQVRDLSQQIDHLSQEIDSMRANNAQPANAYISPAARTAATPDREEPATVLVFKDQHVQQVHSYAIVGSKLWILNSDGTSQKILLADLDLPQTEKVNDERGVTFRPPAGQ